MQLRDFDSCREIESEEDLRKRLLSTRRGLDGAFTLSHDDDGALSIHIHGNAAFLCFLPHSDGEHPGFIPEGMWTGDRIDVCFLQTSGVLADSIIVPWCRLVPVEAAYQAAVEYLHQTAKPQSINWFEL